LFHEDCVNRRGLRSDSRTFRIFSYYPKFSRISGRRENNLRATDVLKANILIEKKMKKVIGILLILVALFLGYLGIKGLNESSSSVKILGIEITAQDSESKEKAYIEMGLGVAALIGGVYLIGQKKG